LTDEPTTDDRLLGGRVGLVQASTGYRVAIDPVLLAAAVPARVGEVILDAGCGTGAASLCLAARVPGCSLVGVERDAVALALARRNAAENRMEARLELHEGPVAPFAASRAGRFDHVMINPPFYASGRHTPSPSDGKAAAHGEDDFDLAQWIAAANTALRAGGRLTLIHRADRIDGILGALGRRFGAALLVPLWPRRDTEAKRIIVSALKGRRTSPRLLPGLVLHEADGRYTPAAEAILRDAAPLDLGSASN